MSNTSVTDIVVSNAQSEDIFDQMAREILSLKTSVDVLGEQLRVHLLSDQQKHQASEIERLSTVVEELKKRIEQLDWQLIDVQSEASLQYQHSKAYEVVMQQLIEATPAASHIDLFYEIENYGSPRHRELTRMEEWYNRGRSPDHLNHSSGVPGKTSTSSDPDI